MGKVIEVVAGNLKEKLLQTITTSKTDTFNATVSAGSWIDFTGLSAIITPTSTSHSVLVMVNASIGTEANRAGIRLTRNGTPVALADSAGSRTPATSACYVVDSKAIVPIPIMFVDSPSTTSAVTYQVQGSHEETSKTLYLNRAKDDSDDTETFRAISTITLMELDC